MRPRELQVLRLAAQGKTYREIATELGISEKTVRVHLENLYRALNVRNKTEAFIKMGWLMT
jgi:DNA-binding NarL/FixJ family response regulator